MKIQIKSLLKFLPILSFFAVTPFTAFAATCDSAGITGVICKTNEILSSILPVLVSFGVIYFVWGMVSYFIGDSEEAKKTGKQRIIYAIIGLTVIISVWGLVNILTTTFGLNGQGAPTADIKNLVPGSSSSCGPIGTGSKFSDVLNYFTCIIGSSIIPFMFAIAMVTFIWGMIKFFIIESDEEAKRAQGKQFMIWSVIAFAVMISVWGLVNILGATFNLKNAIPSVQPK